MFLNFIKSDIFSIIVLGINLILLVLFVSNEIKLKKINKDYNSFMKKLGKGNNIEEMLKKYIQTVDIVDNNNKELMTYCHQLDKDMASCIQKIGIVRYNAFKDTGSDLSFAVALLDENNNGIILNGIYSREMSNIYAKEIKNGQTINKLSEEEVKAINIAIKQEQEYKIKE